MLLDLLLLSTGAGLLPLVASHAAMFHPSMWGFNATAETPFYGAGVPGLNDNRPVVPLYNRTFEQWWFHGYHDLPPHPDDIMQLPAGGTQNVEIACGKQFTSYWPMVSATDQSTDNPCPGSSSEAYHTGGIDDLGGCALAISYESDASLVKPEDFTVFSVNQTCVWKRNTEFQVPAAMPPCPNGKCTCAWFWIHKEDAGSEQNYMIAFQCNIAGATGTQAVAKGNPARRCGEDPKANKPADPSNCTIGARTPSYWYQLEQNNFFEDTLQPPLYTDLYGWTDGAQNDIFRSVPFGTDPNATVSSATTAVPTSTQSLSTSTDIPSSTTTATTSAATSTPSSSLIPSGPRQTACFRPQPQQPASNMMQVLADSIGLGSLRRRQYERRLRKVEVSR